jgi:hypothetical protein
MKKIVFLLFFTFSITTFKANGQTCEEIMEFVKSKSYGTTYTSYNSDAISSVTFYDIMIDYQSYYFAIVCFKQGYISCNEYIYQVESSTKMYYSMNYINSAGKAFWSFIQPYNKNLGCATDID